jgi:hypothetical protein
VPFRDLIRAPQYAEGVDGQGAEADLDPVLVAGLSGEGSKVADLLADNVTSPAPAPWVATVAGPVAWTRSRGRRN